MSQEDINIAIDVIKCKITGYEFMISQCKLTLKEYNKELRQLRKELKQLNKEYDNDN